MLVSMAERHVDPSFPMRRMISEDHYYTHWHIFYDGISAWAELGKTDWSDTSRWGSSHGDHRFSWEHKTPSATNIVMLYKDWSHAATVIQAAWRAWRWRLFVLWNPSSVIGGKRLASEAAQATEDT